MQRMKQLAMGAFSMAMATTGLALAGGDQQHEPATSANQPAGSHQQGGDGTQRAPRTGSAASSGATMNHSGASASSASRATGGMSHMQVEQLQRELAQRGLYQGAIDGMAGPQTMAALRQFQQQQGLPDSGGLDDATRQALGIQLDRQSVSGAQASGPELERPVGREGATPAVTGDRPMRSQVQLDTLNQQQLSTLQTRLQELGFYQGPVDGVLGEGTRSALRQFFQTQADLASRGIITDATVGVFGVSPQGLNGAPPASTTQRGTQPRGTDTRGSMSPSTGPTGTRNSMGRSSTGSSSTPGTPPDVTINDDMSSPSGSANGPTRSTPPAPGGQSGTTPR